MNSPEEEMYAISGAPFSFENSVMSCHLHKIIHVGRHVLNGPVVRMNHLLLRNRPLNKVSRKRKWPVYRPLVLERMDSNQSCGAEREHGIEV
jgi:hypothetical protein